MLSLARAHGCYLATAESCTGGMVGTQITAIPGSSDVYLGGFVTYSNKAKEKLLSVPSSCLEAHGAVSKQTALAMAAGCSASFDDCLAVSITGIAGPGGGSDEKPVGLVYIATAMGMIHEVRHFVFSGDREEVRSQACAQALASLGRHIITHL
jgi:competence/damage-inducible protein CinA C-terminal domain